MKKSDVRKVSAVRFEDKEIEQCHYCPMLYMNRGEPWFRCHHYVNFRIDIEDVAKAKKPITCTVVRCYRVMEFER